MATEVRTTVFDIQKNTEVRYQRIWTGTWRGYKTRYVTCEYEGTVPTDLGPEPSAIVNKGTLHAKTGGVRYLLLGAYLLRKQGRYGTCRFTMVPMCLYNSLQ